MIKQRVARKGQGKRDGYRMLVFYRTETRTIFVYGFAKNDRDNIDDDELKAFRKAAGEALAFSADVVSDLVARGSWQEVDDDDED